MAPIIATLLAQGLGILGNAVIAKGKDVIEEKLGISLEDSVKTEEGLITLKKLEIEHEQFLIDSAITETKLYVEDTKSARSLGIALSQSTSWLNQNIMPVLALVTVFGGAWMLVGETSNEVKMAATSFITMVLGYFFGSSKGSKDKQQLLETYRK